MGMKEYAYTERHMGTQVSLSLVAPSEKLANRIAAETFTRIRAYEARFSRFEETSELSALNVKKDMRVSEEFFTVLTRSYELYMATGGAFNPLVQIAKHGYTTDYANLRETTRAVNVPAYNTDFTTVVMEKDTRRVALAENQTLDFGGFLKGYLASLLAHEIEQTYRECTGIIVNLGGDLHTRGHDEHGRPFIFSIYNPIHDTRVALPLTNTSLATSGTYTRSWRMTDGTVRHHILSPHDLTNTATAYVSASVVHEDGATAEAYAKLFIIGDSDTLNHQQPDGSFGYHLIRHDGTHLSTLI